MHVITTTTFANTITHHYNFQKIKQKTKYNYTS